MTISNYRKFIHVQTINLGIIYLSDQTAKMSIPGGVQIPRSDSIALYGLLRERYFQEFAKNQQICTKSASLW